MPRIHALNRDEAPAKAQPLLDGVQKKLGMTPNIMATLAHSPAALQSYLGFGQALAGGELGGALHEQIALAVAGENSCGYCASAHTLLGKNAGVESDELARNLRGESADPRTKAALDFARVIVQKRGFITDADLSTIRGAGFSDGQAIEILAGVTLNIFTNYFNHIAGTEIDFPVVEVDEPVSA